MDQVVQLLSRKLDLHSEIWPAGTAMLRRKDRQMLIETRVDQFGIISIYPDYLISTNTVEKRHIKTSQANFNE
jgi:hypothetical protein